MEWTAPGIVLAARAYGEADLILDVLAEGQGRVAGLLKGGRSPRRRAGLDPGALVAATWRARLEAHLGSWSLEPIAAPAARLLDDAERVEALAAAAQLLALALPERQPADHALTIFARWLDQLAADDPAWRAELCRLELALLAELGYGLDLAACAVTGARPGPDDPDPLAFVSPRSGRAVRAAAAGDWAARLLPLPRFLRPGAEDDAAPPPADLAAGLTLTGAFLARHALDGRPPPPARARLLARWEARGRTARPSPEPA